MDILCSLDHPGIIYLKEYFEEDGLVGGTLNLAC